MVRNGVDPSAASSASAAEPASLLASPETSLEQSGDPSAMLAALTMKTARGERQAHTAMRRSEEATQDSEEAKQVSALREKAEDIKTGAIVSGLTTIGSSVVKGIGAGASTIGLHAGAAGIQASKVMSAKYDAVAGVVGGAGGVFGGVYKSYEAADDAKAAEHEHLAGHAKRAAEDEVDAVKDAKDLMDKAIEFYKEYSTGKNQAMAAATHRA